MRRTLILTALGATTLSIGLGLGASLASADPSPSHPTVTTGMMANGDISQMHDGTGMTQMMASAGMTGMGANDMNAMHATMHTTAHTTAHTAHHQGATP
jgi:hypothetical protein